jgi:hypothetical protein
LSACLENLPDATRSTAAKITQRAFGRLPGKLENTISRQLRGKFVEAPDYLIAIIALEHADGDQRSD